ncbi:Shedu anti-phage system protein SduA domain-containing protein [Actinomadura mexicana]|uniref:Shedu protein SduA C-terminal domain-containing protein n=1 Tax=Actinomadura mexicana TaxID=134959 RepID=A0A239HR99_9ACTN|nr:Shedu anti-phage system protein SduA domain-containing protein [Actinomadura mexicana]SNS83453.1 protein of unknown function [Actinomadura mexicana]
MSVEENLQRISDALVGVEHTKPIVKKYAKLEIVLADLLKISPRDIYGVWVSKAANQSVRATQSDRGQTAKLLVSIFKRTGHDEHAIRRAARKYAEKHNQPLLLIQEQTSGELPWLPIGAILPEPNEEALKIVTSLRDELDLEDIVTVPVPDLVHSSIPRDHLTLLESIRSAGVDAAELGRALSGRSDISEILSVLLSTKSGLTAAEVAIVARRRDLVSELKELAKTPGTTETQMHKAIGKNYWLFGGRYSGVADRRHITILDQYDIPLICADGSLHLIELKGPDIKDLVYKHRSHMIAGTDIHEAASQSMNYLRALDEQGATLETQYRNELGVQYDLRRARATVVIGHQDHAVSEELSRRQVDHAIRSYNAHLSRVEVLTYADLLDSAERALNFDVEMDS